MRGNLKENRREKPEEFIGWKSPDGKLEVTEIYGKQGRTTLFKVTCTECSKDAELFPDGYFVSIKSNLVKGAKPCGCSKMPRWKDWQYLILTGRIGENKGFIVHGFAEEYRGHKTRLNLECLKDGHKWKTSVNCIMNKQGCPKCKNTTLSEQKKIPENIALERCIRICNEMEYKPIGFLDNYESTVKTKFKYSCKAHGEQVVTYNKFVNSGNRCPKCAKDIRKKAASGLYGYYQERKDEKDFLYVLNFSDKFIKVGRSFDVDGRMKKLKTESKIKKIYKMRIFSATHQEIYDLEQELHSELRERNFQHYVGWSTECFDNDSLYLLNWLLDSCGLEEIQF